ncbi:MAG: hypothetical protein ACRYHC_10045 [Janthinobacterium lividum]
MNDSPDPGRDIDDIPDFTPVPLQRVRHDGWTPERQRRFVVALRRLGVVAAAARAVGMSVQSAYRLRERPGADSFAAAWDGACAEAGERAFEVALSRGIDGYVQPLFYRGRQVGTAHRFDNRLAMAALNAMDRARPPRRQGGG